MEIDNKKGDVINNKSDSVLGDKDKKDGVINSKSSSAIKDDDKKVGVINKEFDSILKKAEKKEKNDEKAQERKKKIKKTVITCVGIGLIVTGILAVGVVIGASGYPKVKNWLVNHNFINQEDVESDEKVGSSSETGVEVISEENTIIRAVEKAQNSVVSIARNQLEVSEEGIVDKNSNIGSGFIVSESGLIITNQHVVSTNDDYKVLTVEGGEYNVVEIIRDDANDIALLRVELEEGVKLDAVELSDDRDLQVGQLVIAIGTPLGEYAGSVTTGVISGLNRSVTATQGGFWGMAKVYENVIQTDAAINPGNSGGPLLNSLGQVIGVNFATTSGADNISFALPIGVVSDRLEEYRKFGKFIKPFLGVQSDTITELEARYYKNVVEGALVVRIVPDSPAAAAGIEKGDIIMEFGGEKVQGALAVYVQEHEVGEEVEVKVWRDGEELVLKVVLGEWES
ncbi:trypsin-like serine protease [Candidatus Dojkabacteria bacterium]|nr:trypsin-like serine protease [Candidatus Dojkabacteria bacterium]